MSAYRIFVTGRADPALGSFGVFAIRECDGKIVSSCTGIRSAALCEQRALDYHFSFGRAPITFGANVPQRTQS